MAAAVAGAARRQSRTCAAIRGLVRE